MRKLLFHVPALGGHHGTFLRYLLEGYDGADAALKLGIVVPEQIRDYPDLEDMAQARGVLVYRQPTARGVVRRAGPFVPWLQSRAALAEFRPTQVTFLYGDGLLHSAFPLRLSLGCSASTILFRPTVHYKAAGFAPLTVGERVRALRQRCALALASQHPQLGELFWLDPYGAKYMAEQQQNALGKRLWGSARHTWLPDPLDTAPVEAARLLSLRQRLSLSPERQVLLLFGPPNERKGVEPVLQALLQLPAEVRAQIQLLLVGKATAARRAALQALVLTVKQSLGGALQWVDETVPEEDVPTYFALCDVVLVPYQRHVGSSGVLIRGAYAGKPVIASDYGLVGQWTRRHQLGAAVDCSSVPAISECLLHSLRRNGDFPLFDRARAQRFGQAFHKSEYARLLLGQGLKNPIKPNLEAII